MPKHYPRELRERAVRLVFDHRADYETEYAAIRSIAAKLGIATLESLRKWVRQADVDSGQRRAHQPRARQIENATHNEAAPGVRIGPS